MAASMTEAQEQQTGKPTPPRNLLITKPHEVRLKTHGVHHVTAINDPHTDRAIGRWLKRAANAKS